MTSLISEVEQRLRRERKMLDEYRQLEKAHKFLTEYGNTPCVSIRFAESSSVGHDEAATTVANRLFADWNPDGKNQAVLAIQKRMKDLEEALS